jgi:hypothetical protein
MPNAPQPWNPWRALRDRPTVRLWFAPLDGRRGLWLQDPEGDLIVLDPGLGRRARRCVLAHELVHAERGIGHGPATDATMAREEETVRREVARRLVPPELLRLFVAAREQMGGVSAADVANEFDVEADVAGKAIELLLLIRL